jgi:hypothetical protein
MLTCIPVAKWSARVRVTSSAFCKEVPAGSRQASMTESRVTIAYPAKRVLSWIKLLPSAK